MFPGFVKKIPVEVALYFTIVQNVTKPIYLMFSRDELAAAFALIEPVQMTLHTSQESITVIMRLTTSETL
jgi:hypothetical protein